MMKNVPAREHQILVIFAYASNWTGSREVNILLPKHQFWNGLGPNFSKLPYFLCLGCLKVEKFQKIKVAADSEKSEEFGATFIPL